MSPALGQGRGGLRPRQREARLVRGKSTTRGLWALIPVTSLVGGSGRVNSSATTQNPARYQARTWARNKNFGARELHHSRDLAKK